MSGIGVCDFRREAIPISNRMLAATSDEITDQLPAFCVRKGSRFALQLLDIHSVKLSGKLPNTQRVFREDK